MCPFHSRRHNKRRNARSFLQVAVMATEIAAADAEVGRDASNRKTSQRLNHRLRLHLPHRSLHAVAIGADVAAVAGKEMAMAATKPLCLSLNPGQRAAG